MFIKNILKHLHDQNRDINLPALNMNNKQAMEHAIEKPDSGLSSEI